MSAYTEDFYTKRHERTLYSARTILSIILATMPKVRSAVDVGCGVGTWLSVIMKKGVKDVMGLDGEWVETNLLVIPKETFVKTDLTKPVRVPRKFDLAISLEVAEHLPVERAKGFVRDLTKLADFVLFSAAVPFQGGRNHINEQWQEYWVGLFAAEGYDVYDLIRPKIWNDSRIPFWYRQNSLFFVKKERTKQIKFGLNEKSINFSRYSVVHPDLYMRKVAGYQPPKKNLLTIFNDFYNRGKRKLKRMIRPETKD